MNGPSQKSVNLLPPFSPSPSFPESHQPSLRHHTQTLFSCLLCWVSTENKNKHIAYIILYEQVSTGLYSEFVFNLSLLYQDEPEVLIYSENEYSHPSWRIIYLQLISLKPFINKRSNEHYWKKLTNISILCLFCIHLLTNYPILKLWKVVELYVGKYNINLLYTLYILSWINHVWFPLTHTPNKIS